MRALLVVSLLCLLATAARGQESLEEALDGFEDDAEPADAPAEPVPPAGQPPLSWSLGPTLWDLGGALTFGASYAPWRDAPPPAQPDYRGLARLQIEGFLQLDGELGRGWQVRASGRGFRDYFYALEGRDEFRDAVLDQYERELEFQELWIRGSPLESLDVKFGRQIVVWGTSDSLRVLDVLNPLDLREPGLVDIEDLRMTVTMTRLDYYQKQWQLSGIAVHETRFDETPVAGSDFNPLGPDLPEQKPSNGGSHTEWAAALLGSFSGFDLSFHWARFYDDTPHLEMDGVLRHARLTLYGAGGQVARGNWLWKGELVYLRGLEFFALPGDQKDRVDALLGVEYAGFDDTTLSLDVANRHLPSYDSALDGPPDFAPRNRVETAFRYTAEFWNARLRTTFLAIVFGARAEDGAVLRLSFDYDLRDALVVGGGLVVYQKGDTPPFTTIDDHDRFFVRLRYSF